MSIKTTKRMALGVIASLVFAPFAALAPASAVDVAGTAVLGPVRVSFTGTNQDTVNGAAVTITAGGAFTDADITTDEVTLTVALTQAPTAAATITVAATNYTDQANAGAHDTAATLASGALLKSNGTDTITTVAHATAGVTFKANVSGTYKGTVTIDGATAASDLLVVPFSFTTTGAPTSIVVGAASINWAAVNTLTKTNTVTLKDAAGNTTQGSTVDTLAVTISDATNITIQAGSDSVTAVELTDGTETLTFVSNGTADTETVTVTPQGTLPASGVAAVTFTATTGGYGVETSVDAVLTSPSSANIVAAGTVAGTEASYKVDPSNATYTFTASGYTVGAAYEINVLWTDAAGANGAATVKDDTSNTTAAALTSGTDKALYGIVGATGSVVVTVTFTSAAADNAGDTIKVDPTNAGAAAYTTADAVLVTLTAATYAVAVTTPAVTPFLAVTSTAIAMAGTVKDTYGNPVSGASVTVTGTITSTVATDTNITGTATTATDGTWSLTMPATTAATASVSLVAAAVKTGLSISSATAVVVNFNASGSPDTLTYSSIGDQGTATVVNPVTQYPASLVSYTGVTGAITDELYTISTAANDGTFDAQETCVLFTPTTSPAGQVVFTGSAGVKFSKTCAGTETLATLTDTVTTGSATGIYAIATKTGENTVTMTSGTKTASAKFYAFNTKTAASAGDAIRNLSADKASLSLKPGEFAVITIAAKDAFGNAVKSAVAAGGATVTVKASGSALVEGPSLSKQFTTSDADGNIMVGVVASQTPGSGTITITGTGAQLAAAAGSATSSTAGTNGLTAASASVTVSVTVAAVEPEPVYEKPTLSFVKDGNRIILSGTAVDGEGDIIIYVKSVGSTTWVEKAKTLEVASPGDFNGSIRAFKKNKVIRVKQEGTGLFSNQIIVTK